jgi:CRP/FNR family cyclic AMP-dependent transcriptional regulator
MDEASFDALVATPLLAGMTRPALEVMAAEGEVLSFPAGAFIVREGEPGHSFFILVEGAVEVVKTNGLGHAIPLAQLKARTFFGEMSVVDPVARTASVRVLHDVKAIKIRAATLYHLFQKMPDQYSILLLNLSRDMARRLRSLDEAYAAKAG